MSNKEYDVIIFGAGPAGLSAGLYLSRGELKTLIIDEASGGGQLSLTHSISNYPGSPEMSGSDLARVMKKQVEDFGCDFLFSAEITSFNFEGDVKTVEIDEEDVYTAHAVIIAVGGVPRMLGLPSEKKFKGRGISYCATCDGAYFKGKDVVAIGGGNTALEESVFLTKFAESVTILHRLSDFQASAYAEKEAYSNSKIKIKKDTEIVEFIGDKTVEKVKVIDHKTGKESEIKCDGAFVFIGYTPNTKMFKGIIDTNDWGEIITDEDMATNVEGVFAAGDARMKKYRQVVTAASDGCIAALAAIDYLRKE
jgi:thioredoxin reductase (NADPH)